LALLPPHQSAIRNPQSEIPTAAAYREING